MVQYPFLQFVFFSPASNKSYEIILKCVTFFFQRTQNTLETCLLTKKIFIFIKLWICYVYNQNTEFLFLRRVKLIFTISSEHWRKERDAENVVTSVSTIITTETICLHGFKSQNFPPLTLTVVDRVISLILEVKKQKLREDKCLALG